jgi:hypothetical protein
MHNRYFARPIPVISEALAAKVAASATLSDDEDDLFTRICGVAPGFPEAWATPEARDAALGEFGPYVQFDPATWAQAEAGGFRISSVAIGHPLRDPEFVQVAAPVLDAIAAELQNPYCRGHDVIIHRTRFMVVRQKDGTVRTCGWATEFDGPVIETDAGMETVTYLDRELNRRLVPSRGW